MPLFCALGTLATCISLLSVAVENPKQRKELLILGLGPFAFIGVSNLVVRHTNRTCFETAHAQRRKKLGGNTGNSVYRGVYVDPYIIMHVTFMYILKNITLKMLILTLTTNIVCFGFP